MSADRMNFDEAARELGISEAELEQLVAAGEIASLKEGDTLYFKKDVVRKFKEQRESEPTILLSDDEISLLDDDNLEEIDLLADDSDEGTTPIKPVEKAAPAATPVPAAAAASDVEEISLDDDLPSLDLDTDDDLLSIETTETVQKVQVRGKGGAAAKAVDADIDETLVNMDGLLEEDTEATTPVSVDADDATLLDTDLLDLSSDADPFSADTAEETSATDMTEAGTLLRGGGARVMQMKRKESHAGLTIVLAVTALFLVAPLGVLTNLVFGSSEDSKKGTPAKDSYAWITDYNFLQGPVEGVADFVKPAK